VRDELCSQSIAKPEPRPQCPTVLVVVVIGSFELQLLLGDDGQALAELGSGLLLFDHQRDLSSRDLLYVSGHLG
jgi:hypothetical protein